MTQAEFQAKLTTLADGWTSRDYQRVIAFFDENVFYSDGLNYRFLDNHSLLGFFQDDDGRTQECEFHRALFDESKQLGAAEYTYKGTYRFHGTVWIEVKGTRIVRWREYQHKSEKAWEEFWNFDERNRP